MTEDTGTAFWHRIGLACLCWAFLLAVLPLGHAYMIHYPDERHYTDAGLIMMQSGDLITPRCADGTLRFRKPIVTYWSVIAGLATFGTTPLGARSLFMAFGAATILVSYALAYELTRCRTQSLLAAIIVACHPLTVLNATRSIPDMPLCFFMTVSLWGFVRIRLRPGASTSGYWLAYIGTAMAVATKGVPALLLPFFVAGYEVFARWRSAASVRPTAPEVTGSPTPRSGNGVPWLHAPSLLVSVLLGGWWFASMAVQHGATAGQVLWEDQIGERVVRAWWHPVWQFPAVFGLLLATTLPWALPAAHGAYRQWSAGRTTTPHAFRQCWPWLTSWVVFYVMAAACVCDFSHRYLLPVVPPVATLLAHSINALGDSARKRWLAWLSTSHLVLIGVLVAFTVVLARSFDDTHSAAIAVAIGCATAGIIWRSRSYRPWSVAASAYAVALLMTFPLVLMNVRVFALPGQESQIAEHLQQLPDVRESTFVIWSKPALASKVRLSSKGSLQVRHVDVPELPKLADGEVLIASEEALAASTWAACPRVAVSTGYRSLKPIPFLKSLLKGTITEYLAANQEHYAVTVPSTSFTRHRRADRQR